MPFPALERVLHEFPLIINTVPAPVLGAPQLACLAAGTLVIDLASAPGGDGAGYNYKGGAAWTSVTKYGSPL